MMKQQVNFYHPVKVTEQKLTAKVISLMWVGLLGIMLTWLIGLYSIKKFSEYKNHAQEEQIISSEEQLKKIKEEIKTMQDKTGLEEEFNLLLQEQEHQLTRLDILRKNRKENVLRFSEHLYALSRQHVKNTWLTSFDIYNGGQSISMSGVALSAYLVPQILQKLEAEPAFNGKTFQSLQMKAIPEGLGITFTIKGLQAKS